MSIESLWGIFRVFLFFGLAFSVIPILIMWRRSKLKNDCTARVDGTVTQCVRSLEHDHGTHYSVVYKTKYNYSVAGVEYAGSAKIKSTAGEKITVYTAGDSIAVYCDPFKPKRHYVEKMRIFWGWWTWSCSLISAVFLILAIWILISEIPAAKM